MIYNLSVNKVSKTVLCRISYNVKPPKVQMTILVVAQLTQNDAEIHNKVSSSMTEF